MFPKLPTNNNTKTAIYFVILALLVLSVFIPGTRRITLFAADATFFFDTVNRMEQGYRMYVDFNHSYGPFSFLLLWAGVKVYGINMDAFTIAQALATLILCSLCVFVTYKRYHPIFTIIILIVSWALINNPTPLGYDIRNQFSVAFWYNNLGFVLAGLLLLQISSRKLTSKFHHEAVLEGVLLALLFTNKFQFLIFLFLPWIVITIRDIRLKQAWLYFGIAFISFFIVTNLQFFLAQTSLPDYISQIQRIVSGSEYASVSGSEGKTFPLLHLFFYRYVVISNYYVFYALALLIFMHILQNERLISWKTLFIASAFISLMFIKISCNFHKYVMEVPFLEFIPLLYITGKQWDFKKSALHFALALLIALPAFLYAKELILSHRYMAREDTNLYFEYPPQDEFIQTKNHTLYEDDAPEFLKQTEEWGYSRFVYDGLTLLKEIEDQDKTLFVCYTTDPITMHTGFKYVQGTFTWYTLREGNIRQHCCDEKFLIQADLVLISQYKPYTWEIADYIQSFGTEISWNVYENENWVLLEKIYDQE